MSRDNLIKRLNFYGGDNTGRIMNNKQWTLKKAIQNSYQSQIIKLNDGKRFRCLINPDNRSTAFHMKDISILHDDICLNSGTPFKQKTLEGIEHISIKGGDTILWEQTNSHWLIYLEYIQELAYFRAKMRMCNCEVKINNNKYWVALETSSNADLDWVTGSSFVAGDLSKNLTMLITKDSNTLDFFHRYEKIKIPEPDNSETLKTWRIVGTNPYYGDGVLQISLEEYYENTIEEEAKKEKEESITDNNSTVSDNAYISGPKEVSAYSDIEYSINNCETNGDWYIIENGKELWLSKGSSIKLTANKKKGSFKLSYRINGIIKAELDAEVIPF